MFTIKMIKIANWSREPPEIMCTDIQYNFLSFSSYRFRTKCQAYRGQRLSCDMSGPLFDALVKVRKNSWVGDLVTYEYYMEGEWVIYILCWCHRKPPPTPSSVHSRPLPSFRGRKVMTTLLIIISSVFICLTASLGAQTPAHSDTHTTRLTQTIFPPGLAGRTTLLIQRREGQLGQVHL